MGHFKDLTGRRFGRLRVIHLLERNGKSLWLCQCDCGKTVSAYSERLHSSNTKSCGCLKREVLEANIKRSTKHGFARRGKTERLYGLWCRMLQRCADPNVPEFHCYGGRGIAVCSEWEKDYVAFRAWAFNNGFADGLTIERKDNNGNYEPDNCVWVTRKIQGRNTRRNHPINFNGETKLLCEWSEIFGLEASLIRYRLKSGWSIEDALKLKPNGAHRGGQHADNQI